MTSAPTRHPVLEELIETGALEPEQATAILGEHHELGRPVRDVAVDLGYVDEPRYLAAVAHLLGSRVVALRDAPPAPDVAKAVPAAVARLYNIVPVALQGNLLVLAVADLPDPAIADELAFALSRPVEFVVAAKGELRDAQLSLYGEEGDEAPGNLADTLESELAAEGEAEINIEHAAISTPVVRFVNLILVQAVKDRASDIHFEPFENEFKIRYRVDGALYEMAPPPKRLALPIVSRLKVLAALDIAEHRLPQDGRIQLDVAGRAIDFRVSTLPTRHGESVVLRVLDRANMQIDIERIGFPDDVRAAFLEDIQKPNGIVIATGPTGSGKTTTLYAALQRINRVDTKILTAEDPVEYDVEGIVQMPIRESIGLDFATALRAFLRQDPDVVMVGEIRDIETARIAIQAALTGHLVFSTLHTGDAAGAVTRLIDMGVEPFLIASTLEAVVAQRLVRGICPACRTAYRPGDAELRLLELARDQLGDRPFHRGRGCAECVGTGHAGRRAIFEYLRVNDALRAEIVQRKPTPELRRKAVALGMRTLRADGIRCILEGGTTVEEVLQYT